MTTPLKPLNIFGEAYSPRFWQQHALVEGTAPDSVAYTRRQPAPGSRATTPAPLSASEAASMRARLVGHIESGKIKKNPGALLVASGNLSRFNRTAGAQDPISQTLLLQSPRGAKAASHLVRIFQKISATDLASAKRQLALAHLTTDHIEHEEDPTVLRDTVLDLFDADLGRIKTKYDNMQVWSLGAVAFAEYAQERAGGAAPLALLELKDMRALRSQLQRSAQVAKQELSDFDGMYRRVASSMMLFTKLAQPADKASVRFPLVVPNLISDGTFVVRHEKQAQLFADIFEQVLVGIEDVRLKSVGPRLAELTEAQTLLGRALRGRSGSPPPIKL